VSNQKVPRERDERIGVIRLEEAEMPRYYFSLSDGGFVPDNKGTPCTTRKDAERYATDIAAEYGRNRDRIPET
jgi:hypothetical protein